MNKNELSKFIEDIINNLYEEELKNYKQNFGETAIVEDIIYDAIKTKLLSKINTKPKSKPKIYRKTLPGSSTTINGATIYQIIQYNPRTDHITISSGFTNNIKK